MNLSTRIGNLLGYPLLPTTKADRGLSLSLPYTYLDEVTHTMKGQRRRLTRK
ncbi:hypothetical protein [Paenibacillus jamilae]|uniref:hypothetical protein n=1 Tax=Paenibacillus jamilae TaxID=114136 RepID=UPI000AA0B539|nr:hypothetical protein [Paenibacillus jamilae]